MRYRIEYADGRCCNFANSRKDLLDWLKLDTKAARLLMEKLHEVNQVQGRTILMVTHDPNAASFCSRILFIQDGVIFHELRRKAPTETREEFYARILQVMAQMGGGSANVL